MKQNQVHKNIELIEDQWLEKKLDAALNHRQSTAAFPLLVSEWETVPSRDFFSGLCGSSPKPHSCAAAGVGAAPGAASHLSVTLLRGRYVDTGPFLGICPGTGEMGWWG